MINYDTFRNRKLWNDKAKALTLRERQTLVLLAHGQTGEQMAEIMTVNRNSANAYVRHMLEKLGLETREQAVIFALGLGLVEPSEAFQEMMESLQGAKDE